jgi:hypothetical protein
MHASSITRITLIVSILNGVTSPLRLIPEAGQVTDMGSMLKPRAGSRMVIISPPAQHLLTRSEPAIEHTPHIIHTRQIRKERH